MTRKEAHQRKNLSFSFYARNREVMWYQDYSDEQLIWLFSHKHIQWSNPMVNLGENEKDTYIEFTEKGRKWHDWYSCTLWQYIKYYIIKVGWWKFQWQKLRIKCGHHYDWQDYVGANIDEI